MIDSDLTPEQEKRLNDLIFSYRHQFLTEKLMNMSDTQFRLRIKCFSELQQKKLLELNREHLDYQKLAKFILIKEALN